jgi:hypothetical protein
MPTHVCTVSSAMAATHGMHEGQSENTCHLKLAAKRLREGSSLD